ncbi:MAG: tetratricopeptide repeat protein [Candidatus Krumholzibacteriota bacterium]|nr:tetratricopeptide repeat protein [Candidatus Krumholzibacteriota bacterium]
MRRSIRIITLVGLAALVVGAAGAWLLHAQPFGPVFDAFAIAAWLGLVLALAGPAALVARRAAWGAAAGSLLAVAAVAVLLLGVIVLVDSEILIYRGLPPSPTAGEWVADLDTLAARMREIHPALFEHVDEATFDAAVRELAAEIPRLGEDDILAGFARIVALPRDAHCLPNVMSFNLDWHLIPLALWQFDDGLYVTNAPRERRGLVGCRLVAIEETPVAEAMERMRRYFTAETDAGWLERGPLALSVGEWLAAEGIARDARRIELTFERAGGERFAERLRTVHYLPCIYWSTIRRVENDAHPVVTNERRDNYAFESLEGGKTVLFRFNAAVDLGGDRSFAGFLDSLAVFVREGPAERLVIDLRSNGGGNGNLASLIVDCVTGIGKFERPGRLYVLISRRSFSAAAMTASMLRYNTQAIFVGETTAQGPDFFSSPAIVRLPECRRAFFVSTRATLATPVRGDRAPIEPDIPVRCTWADFAAGRDAAIDLILGRDMPRVRSGPPELDAALIRRLVGRYRFSPWQSLDMEHDEGGLRLRIDDAIEGSLCRARTDVVPVGDELGTGIPGVFIRFVDGVDGKPDSLLVDWRGHVIVAPRAPADWSLPMELVAAGRVEEGIDLFRRDIAPIADKTPQIERMLNNLGYRFMRNERLDDAIAVFELNTELYPRSANAWDSLGEGCMEAGRTKDAIRFYEKSLDLNPDNANAKRMLERLRGSGEGRNDP